MSKPLPETIDVTGTKRIENGLKVKVTFSAEFTDDSTNSREIFNIELVQVKDGLVKWPDEGLPFFNEKCGKEIRNQLRERGYHINDPRQP